jgi:hypothetical protein
MNVEADRLATQATVTLHGKKITSNQYSTSGLPIDPITTVFKNLQQLEWSSTRQYMVESFKDYVCNTPLKTDYYSIIYPESITV